MSHLPPVVNEGGSPLNVKEEAKRLVSEYWAVIAAIIFLFGPILWILFDFQGRLSAQEAKLQLYEGIAKLTKGKTFSGPF